MSRISSVSIQKAVRRSHVAQERFLSAAEDLQYFESDPVNSESWMRALYDCVPDTRRAEDELDVHVTQIMQHTRLMVKRARRYQRLVRATCRKQRVLYGRNAHIRPTISGLGMHVTF